MDESAEAGGSWVQPAESGGPQTVDHWLAIAAVLTTGLLAEGASGVFMDPLGWLGLIIGALTVLIWLLHLVTTIARGPGRSRSGGGWAAVVIVPVLAAVTFAGVAADVPSRVRFELSNPALRAAAEHAMAGPITVHEERWSVVRSEAGPSTAVGFYQFAAVDRSSSDTVIFLVDSDGILTDAGGFAYRTSGTPDVPYAVTIDSIGGGWWVWYEEWD